MAKTDRESGHIAPDVLRNLYLGMRTRGESAEAVEDGSACAGCETPIAEDSGVECYCAVEDFGYAHEQYRWCTQDCFNRTHEDCHPDPPDREEYDG